MAKRNQKTEVDPFWELSDIKNMLDYMEMQNAWKWHLVLILGLTLGRRVFDTLAFKVSDFFDDNANIRDYVDIQERKTLKISRLQIGNWLKKSILIYAQNVDLDLESEIYLFPSKKKTAYDLNAGADIYKNRRNNIYDCSIEQFCAEYKLYCLTIQKKYTPENMEDTYKLWISRNTNSKTQVRRKEMTLGEFLRDQEWYEAINTQSSAYRSFFKKAADFCDIKYPVSTHTPRKTFGLWSRKLHPYDIDSLEILQEWYGHSDIKTTMHYIGLDKQRISKYANDMDDLLQSVSNGEDFKIKNAPVISVKTADLREIIMLTINASKNGEDADKILNDAYTMVEELAVN